MSAATQPIEPTSGFVAMDSRELIAVLAWGAVVGLLVWLATWVLDVYVYQAILCSGTGTNCDQTPQYASVTATIVVAILSLFGLIRMRVYRPLLIVLASAISLWGVILTLSVLPWYWAALAAILLYGLAYGLFTWISRIRLLWLMLAVTILLIVLVRLVVMS